MSDFRSHATFLIANSSRHIQRGSEQHVAPQQLVGSAPSTVSLPTAGERGPKRSLSSPAIRRVASPDRTLMPATAICHQHRSHLPDGIRAGVALTSRLDRAGDNDQRQDAGRALLAAWPQSIGQRCRLRRAVRAIEEHTAIKRLEERVVYAQRKCTTVVPRS